MHKIYYILFLFFISNSLFGQQNLVKNFDFEDTISCPTNMLGEIEKAKYWTSPILTSNQTSDYFNTCSYYYSTFFQNSSILPNSGSGFVGIDIFSGSSSYSYREYIEGQTINKLIRNKRYCISFKIRPNPYNKFLVDTLHFYFTENILKTDSFPKVINVTPDVFIDISKANDTLNWYSFETNFIAEGNEKYFTFGNFNTNDSTSNTYVNWGVTSSYYFFDDVKVYYCGPDTIPQTTDTLIIPNVFTPNGDGYNDVFNYKNQQQWDFETQIYNRWGELLFSEQNTNWDGYYKGKKVSEGVYFYKITAKAKETGEIRVYNGAVHVLY